jgi:hypothetical protein
MHSKQNSSNLIRSLSGLANYNGLVIGTSDEFNGLFVRNGREDKFYNFSTQIGTLDFKEQKKIKNDHESLSIVSVMRKDFAFCFPSLSKPNRNQVGIFNIEFVQNQFYIRSHRYFEISKLLDLLKPEVNIEGHFLYNNTLHLLSRGNQSAPSELIKIENGNLWTEESLGQSSDKYFDYKITRQSVCLGSVDGHPIHWTDGFHEKDSTFVFLGTVEKTSNSYDDGDVMASFIGRYDTSKKQVTANKKILDFKKAEGICRWNSEYLVCIDSDSAEMSNEFYSLPLDILG